MSCHCVHCTGVYAPHKDLLLSIPLLVAAVKTLRASQIHILAVLIGLFYAVMWLTVVTDKYMNLGFRV